MNTAVVGIVTGCLGIALAIASIWWTKRQSRMAARGRIVVASEQGFELNPAQYIPDLSHALKISFDGVPVPNFVCLHLSIRNDGYQDYENREAREPRKPNEPYRPCIDFSNLRILAVGTRNNDPNLFDIPLGRANNDTRIILNIARLVSRAEARFVILGTKPRPSDQIGLKFTPGHLHQMDIVSTGMGVG